MKRPYYLFFILLALTTSCSELEPSPSTLVVEGWIDYGENPIVQLTWSVPVSEEKISINDLNDYVEQWAKVTVSDGEQEVILMGVHTPKYFPPYIYTTTKIEGEIGKTYTLTVECKGVRAEAQTTILPPTEVKSFQVKPVNGADTLRELYAFIDMSDESQKYYKFYVRVGGSDFNYMSSYLGIASSNVLNDDGKMAVYNGKSNLKPDFTPYFNVGDTVSVKLARLTSKDYEFWRTYEELSALSNSPLFPIRKNLPSNITGGAGYWMGLGSSIYHLKIGENGVTPIGKENQ